MFALSQRLFTHDEHLAELITKSGINLTFRFAGMLLGFLFVWLVIRWFGTSVYGKWALAFSILSIVSGLVSFGIGTSIVFLVANSRAANQPRRLRDAYLKSLTLLGVSGILCGVGLFAFSDFLAYTVFKKPGLEVLLRIAAFGVLPINIVMLNGGALRGLRQISAHSFVERTGTPLFAIALLILGSAAFDFGNFFALAYVGSLWLLAGVSYVLWAWLSGFSKLPKSSERFTYRQLFDVSMPMYVVSSVNMVRGWSAIIILGLFWRDVDLAAFALVMRIATLTAMPLLAINSTAAPKFAEFHTRGDISGLRRFARQTTRNIFWLSFPILFVLLFFGKTVLGVFDGALTFGAVALVILALGHFFNAISGSTGLLLIMTGRQHLQRNIAVLTTVLSVILNCILIPPYGLEGAAIATSLSIVVNNAAGLYKIKMEFAFVPIYFPRLYK